MVLGGLVLKWGRRYLYAMLLRPEYLSQKVDRPLPTKDGSAHGAVVDALLVKRRTLHEHLLPAS